ncbi:TetR/AcrR family transcriptional regulator [Litorihabitans aurantiacus]|uniref:Transcriptional regulator n=1 Tax=Litorihabitans aurantiacus TaxID=1930061 RepID=A0AA37XCI8_9MICO|nr:TetR/AcrR family transcriptional regulator [Litorihabitans aurantiacus]GMA30136.1 transcriptional regulator [Litorihabitans aurantiacus]
MRESKRTVILDAAAGVIESEGITAVTFDSVAAAAGITRGGIIYHFPSREELIAAIHEHMARRWEDQLEAACGKPADQSTATERLIAYISMAATPATRAEVQMILDSHHTENQDVWDQVLQRWAPRPQPSDGPSYTLALLAADGLWVNDVIGSTRIPPEQRHDTAERIIDLIRDTDRSAP